MHRCTQNITTETIRLRFRILRYFFLFLHDSFDLTRLRYYILPLFIIIPHSMSLGHVVLRKCAITTKQIKIRKQFTKGSLQKKLKDEKIKIINI